ncbi:MAG: PD-(D/E)XK nuclease family protein [Clostridia bacterium]|nr:PD-(D/E)XK nuclease family protein [Clostridia bacterium]
MKIIHSRDYRALLSYLYKISDHVLDEGRKLLVLVPSQATYLVEKAIITHLGDEGIMDIEVLSFESLVERITNLSGGRSREVLDAAGFSMLAKLAMTNIKDELQVFDSEDFTLNVQVGELISSLKSENVSLEDLERMAGDSEGVTREKMSDLSRIYREIDRISEGRYQDRMDVERSVHQVLRYSTYLKERRIAVFGFDILPRLRMQTICELDRASQGVEVLAMGTEGDYVTEKQWENIKQLEEMGFRNERNVTLKELGAESGNSEVDLLFENLYAYPYRTMKGEPKDIFVSSYKDRRDEVQDIAKQILDYTCNRGFRMDDIGIITGDVGGYSTYVTDIFSAYDIPYFLQSKRSLSKSVLYAYMKPLLKLVSRRSWMLQDVLMYLKSGLVRDNLETDRFIRFVLERGYRGYRFMKEFTDPDAQEFENFRHEVFDPVLDLRKDVEKGEISSKLLKFCHDMKIPVKIAELETKAREDRLEEEARFLAQVWPATEEIIRSSKLIEDIDIKEYAEAVSVGMESKDISVIPPTTDEVQIGDAIQSIWSGKKILFVMGVNEGVLPKPLDRGEIFSDFEVDSIKKGRHVFPESTLFQDQKAFLRKNLSITKRLHLSYVTENMEESFLIDRVKRLFPDLQENRAKDPEIYHRRASLPALARELREYRDYREDLTTVTALYIEKDRKAYDRVMDRIENDRDVAVIDERYAKLLYGEPKASVSGIQDYYTCPYRHFISSGIKPDEIKELNEDAADVGTYIHGIMEGFTTYIENEGVRWDALSDSEIDRRIDIIAADLRKKHNNSIFEEKRFEFSEKRLREEAKYAAKAVKRQLEGTSAKVVAGEKRFGKGTLRIDTKYGPLIVQGIIDRVDESESDAGNEYIRIVDYKTGGKDFRLSEVYYGIGIQLIVYLMAAISYYREHGREVRGAGGFYFSIKMPYLDETVDDEARLKSYRMSGYLLSSEDALRSLDSGDRKAISMNVSASDLVFDEDKGSVKGNNCFTEGELADVFSYVKRLLVDATEEIYSGTIRKKPLVLKNYDPCRYCDYSSVCMVDRQKLTEDLTLADAEKKEILDLMREKVSDNG